jgi:methyl-accepting chemotaxis protein
MRFNIQFKMLLGFVLVVLLVSGGSVWSILILKQTWADQVTVADFREAEESIEVFAEAGLLQKLDMTRKKALVTDRIIADPEGDAGLPPAGEATDPESIVIYSYSSAFDQEADEIDKQLRKLRPILARLNRSEGMRLVRAGRGSRGLPAVLRSIEADFAEYRRLFHHELKTPVSDLDMAHPEEGWHPLVDAMDRRIARDLVMPVAEARMHVETAASDHQEEGQQLVAVLPLVPGLVAILISFLISRRIANPIRELRRATERIAGGDFTRPIREQSRDEVGDLARAMNTMSRRLAELDEMKSGFL